MEEHSEEEKVAGEGKGVSLSLSLSSLGLSWILVMNTIVRLPDFALIVYLDVPPHFSLEL